MDILLQDFRYAARKLLRTPGFTIVAVATLALAIGATTAVFSIVNGVLLEPLPFHEPNGIVIIGSSSKDAKLTELSAPDYLDYRDETHSFVGTAAVEADNSANLSIAGAEPVRLTSAAVGAKFFDLLDMRMELGRGFMLGDDEHGGKRVAVVSDHLWRTTLGSDPNVVGRTISLNGNPYVVVGVAPAALTYPSKPDLWVPLFLEAWMTDPSNRGAHFLSAIARLRPGVTLDAAQRDMAAVGERLRREYPKSNTNFGGAAESLQTWLTGDVRPALLTMFGAVAFVLLIACANVANLLLVRAAGRETEIAVRTALGAKRSRIVRQLVTESLLLSAAGAMIGGALAAWAVDGIVAYGPSALPRLENITVDWHVLVFSAAVAVVTGLLFGLVPALHSARLELSRMLKEGARGSAGGRSAGHTRSALVMTEMALAVVLLVGAGLLIKSFVRLLEVNPGFQPDHLMTFNVSPPPTKYAIDRDLRRFAADAETNLAALPGVQSVAVTFERPLEHGGMRTSFDIDGRAPASPANAMHADVRPASASFFSTMGMHLLRGRVFTPAEENFGPPPVVVVTEGFAKRYFPHGDAIGQYLRLGISHDTAAPPSSVRAEGRIVGVIADVRNQALNAEAYPTIYIGWGTLPFGDITMLVRYRGDAQSMSSAIRGAMRRVDPDLPVYDLRTMQDVVSESVAQPRFYMVLLTAFAALALLLAALGIYGVVSYTVSQRTRELGIRIALGATHDRVVRLVLGQGVMLTLGGVALGLVAAYWLAHVLATLLFGVAATDAPTFGLVAALLFGVACLASYLPARRAARVDPVIAMRAE